ncbi:NAD-dependent succinate-semialdehyde dehydrogenase [Nafulsella turpanensis]|uniref:NAD-dependent succinate-semialdehyde dehydrogenase n=1 Tax=Nafulsella turpanensis TaxID=1265690 RepID=UPI00034DBFA0|nr:NAD-dependent succinate-semialdehyde dehydrogenase [Nafulsella turpanensis]
MSIQSINPYTNEVIKQFEEATDEEVKEVLRESEKAYQDWKETSFRERAAVLEKAADVMEDDIEHYAYLMTLEMGKVKREAHAEIKKCAACCRYFAKHAESFLQNETLPVEEGEAYIAYDPIGPVLAVMPWNFPYWQVIRFAAPNLMAGNAGVLKHASNVPQVSMALEEIFLKAGLPENVFKSLLVGSSKINKIIDNPSIKAVTLTGSEEAGSKVAERAGRNIKKTVLELGGSDPFVVLEDADLEMAATEAVKARMVNNGQSCIAAKRFIVLKEVYHDFLELFREKMAALKIGDPTDEDNDYGPMARQDLADELLEQVKETVKKGAKVVLGGDRPKMEGAFFNPTILTEIKKGSPAFKDELFGPVASVFEVKNEKEAIKLANNSIYGLGGSVWTNDRDRGQYVARQINSGAVYVNKMMASDPAVPFGGVKHSGYGRELSYLGIREFMNQKTIWVK